MKRASSFFFCVLLVLAFGCAGLWAQGTAQISGTVMDPSGARLPGAEVMATQTATGLTRSVVSNESGTYVLPSLPTGPYRLEVALPGFRTVLRTGIVLEVNANPVVDVTLEVGRVTETIEVQANAALVETRSVGVGQVMEARQILELPLNGRNVTELITLSGAAVAPPDGSSSRSISGQQNIRVAGGISGSVNYSLDGALHRNPYDNLSMPLPFPDALQEFKVETSALAASQGGASGAQASAVTKSGTNEFHGNLFEFVRNDLFNATPYFAAVDSKTGKKKPSTLKRNQFGGTAGGPLVKNRLFFFGGYQGTTIRQDPSDNEAFVPTPAMLTGDFTALSTPACGSRPALRTADGVDSTPTGFGAGANTNKIDPSLFSPVALNVAKRLPQPQDACGRVIYGSPTVDDQFQIVGRTDWQASPRHSVMGRVLLTGLDRPVPYNDLSPDNILTVRTGGRTELAQSYSIGDTWLINSNTVASVRLASHYTNIRRIGAEMFNMSEMGVKNLYTGYQPMYSTTNVTNGFSLGGGTENDSNLRTFTSSLNSDISLTRGTHQIAVGGSLMFWDSNSLGNVFSMGVFTFNGNRTGHGLADFLTGRMTTFRQATPNFNRAKKYSPALYVNDSWKATRKLTLNYGLRWEPDIPEILKEGSVQDFSEARRAAGIQSTLYKNAPLGFYYPGDPGHPGKRGREKNWSTFAPRLGFAWDVNGDGKTSVRASGGLGYDYLNIQAHLWTSISPPFNYDITIQNPRYDDPWATYPGGNPFPVKLTKDSPFTAFGGMTVMPYHLDPSQTQSWNLSIQRQLTADLLVSASYLGNHVVHMLMTAPLNPGIYFPGNADSSGRCFAQGYTFNLGTPNGACSTNANVDRRRVLSLVDFDRTGRYVGALAEYQSVGKLNYNGMLLEARKRAGRGLTLNANYTWSHCLASDQDTLNGNLYDSLNTYIYVNERDRGFSNCTSDRRHVSNISGIAQMPRFANETLNKIASGWQVAPIYRIQSGSWQSIIAGPGVDSARNGTASASQPADQVLPNAYGDASGRPMTYWINRDAFKQPAVGTLGNVKPRTVRGPKFWSFDLALSRTFGFKESQRFEFRAEAYNVTNSFRPVNPSAAQNNAQFGLIRQALEPRILQFALKYAF